MKKITLLFTAMFLVVGFTFSQTNTLNTVSQKKGYKVGDTAKDFNLKNIDDTMVSLESLKKQEGVKGFIVTFTCNTCPVSIAYEKRIIDLHNKYAPMGYPVVAIMPNDPELRSGDSFEEMKIRAKEQSFPFVYLYDEGQKVYPEFGATKTPHVFILNKNLGVEYIGAIDDNRADPSAVTARYVEDAIAALEKGEQPEPSFTRAVGCSIKDKRVPKRRRGSKGKRKSSSVKSNSKSGSN